MQIDWFTFAAQAVNFLILVWLLKRFLYRPILKAIDEREKAIDNRLQSATQREDAAAKAQQSYEAEQTQLAHLKESLIADATSEVEDWKKQQLSELRKEVAAARRTWQNSVAREQRQFLGELQKRIAAEVQEITRHVLQEIADGQLEHLSIKRFLSLLRQDGGGLAASGNGWHSSDIVIRTAFPISPDDKATLSEDLTTRTQAKSIRFEVEPDLICGIELVAGDHKLQWNVDNYLETMERSITTALDQQAAAKIAD